MSGRAARWIGRGLRRARSRWVRGGAILGYHRVSTESHDPLRLAVSPENFAAHLEVMQHLGTPVALHELVRAIGDGDSLRGAVAVTFDDGYADNLRAAKPALSRLGIPATVYVVSGWLGQRFWWDELVARVSDRKRALRIHRRLLRVPHEAGRRLDEEAPAAKEPGAAPRVLTADELQELAEDGLVSIGAHSVTHPRLTALETAEQRHEIRRSKEELEGVLGRPVETFAYPWGAATDETRRLVHEAGFAWACSARVDIVSRSSNPYDLPRLWAPDVEGDRFAGWLSGWLGG